MRVWDLKDGKEIFTFTVDVAVTACIVARDNRTIVAGDGFGRMHFLQLVEADKTKPSKRRLPIVPEHLPPINPRRQSRDEFWGKLWGRRPLVCPLVEAFGDKKTQCERTRFKPL